MIDKMLGRETPSAFQAPIMLRLRGRGSTGCRAGCCRFGGARDVMPGPFLKEQPSSPMAHVRRRRLAIGVYCKD